MGLIFAKKRVAFDTSPFIYFFEENPVYLAKVLPWMEKIGSGEIEAFTSVVSLIEALVVPLRKGHQEMAAKYERFLLNSEHLTLFEVTSDVGKKAAELRAKYRIHTPDAIQLAVALVNKADLFLTNDEKLTKVKEIKVVTLKGGEK